MDSPRVALALASQVVSAGADSFAGVAFLHWRRHPSRRASRRRLFIDHATGVVIGETAIVGSDVTMYQGVTLGGTGKGHGKRHPTVCDGVFIGNNANILAT